MQLLWIRIPRWLHNTGTLVFDDGADGTAPYTAGSVGASNSLGSVNVRAEARIPRSLCESATTIWDRKIYGHHYSQKTYVCIGMRAYVTSGWTWNQIMTVPGARYSGWYGRSVYDGQPYRIHESAGRREEMPCLDGSGRCNSMLAKHWAVPVECMQRTDAMRRFILTFRLHHSYVTRRNVGREQSVSSWGTPACLLETKDFSVQGKYMLAKEWEDLKFSNGLSVGEV